MDAGDIDPPLRVSKKGKIMLTRQLPSTPLFPLGKTSITPGLMAEMEERFDVPALGVEELLLRHATGDWGDLEEGDVKANAEAVRSGERILSAYHLRLTGDERSGGVKQGPKVYIITEWDRSYTTLMLAEEY